METALMSCDRLLLNGVVCTMQDKFTAAETFFEAAVTFEPQSILAWTMFGLCLFPHSFMLLYCISYAVYSLCV